RLSRIFFFFQAEDGIRDFHVTGVQTCALPIFLTTAERLRTIVGGAREVIGPSLFGTLIIAVVYLPVLTLTGVEGKMFTPMALTRSEERRVGKEGRYGWSW